MKKHLLIVGIIFLFIVVSFQSVFANDKNISCISAIFDDKTCNISTYYNLYDKYILFTPTYSGIVYLIDMNGTIVHTWRGSTMTGLDVHLFKCGDVLRSFIPGISPTFIGGGMTGCVERINWRGKITWSFEYFTDKVCLHHDFEVLPNGNILMIAWELKTEAEAIQAGRNPDKILFGQLWSDHIIEINPVNNKIFWEWHAWDHLIQDYDQTKDNYGVVGDHPELIDINFITTESNKRDWLHTNAVDYNEGLDQILLSVHNFNEIWVIAHNTTTEEASGFRGNLLYRWGNPMAYRAGEIDDQKFYRLHDAQWIKDGCSGAGNILIFNNGCVRGYSSVDEIVPPIDDNGNYYSYEPEEPIWVYDEFFYSPIMSGVERLPNGNTIICDGYKGEFFEVTIEKEIIWNYTNPYPNGMFNDVFKIYQCDLDYLETINDFKANFMLGETSDYVELQVKISS